MPAFNANYSFKNDLSLKWGLHWYRQVFYKNYEFFASPESLPSAVKCWYMTSVPSIRFLFLCLIKISAQSVFNPPFFKCVFSQRLDFWVEIIFHTHTKLVSLGNNDQFKMICTTLKIYGYNKFWLFTCCWISKCFGKVCVIDSSSWF